MKIVQGLILKTRQNRHCPNSKPKFIVFPHCYDLGLSPNNYFHSSLCGPSPHRKPKEKFRSSDLKGKRRSLFPYYFGLYRKLCIGMFAQPISSCMVCSAGYKLCIGMFAKPISSCMVCSAGYELCIGMFALVGYKLKLTT
jgi:hypothetical protein